jgi:hypothetical protein
MNSDAATLSSRFVISRDVFFSPLTEHGCIVLNLERGTVLSLNDTGALMFSKIAAAADGLSRAELLETVSREFVGVEPVRVLAAVDDLLAQLERKGTIQNDERIAQMRRRDIGGAVASRIPVAVAYLVQALLHFKAYTTAALVLLFTAEFVRQLGGFRSIHRTVARWTISTRSEPTEAILASACSAVNNACTWHPKRALCLQRASVLVCLLRSLGFPAEMIIGVHKMPFYGHAWAEVGGKVVNDHPNAQNFFHVLSRC